MILNTKVGIRVLVVIVGVFLLIGIISIVVERGQGKITNYPPHSGPIVAFGDSLVSGVGTNKGNDFVSLLSNDIGLPIINMGISGNTTEDALLRIDDVLGLQPSIVIVLLGGNDYLRQVPQSQTFANLENIIEQLHANGALVILLGVRGGVVKDQFAEDFERISDKHETAFLPNILRGLIGNQSLMADTIHPNDAGHRRIADSVLPLLRSVLK